VAETLIARPLAHAAVIGPSGRFLNPGDVMRIVCSWVCIGVILSSVVGCDGGGPPVGPSKEAPSMAPAPGTSPEMQTGGKAKKAAH
jgi:hypothetical protein